METITTIAALMRSVEARLSRARDAVRYGTECFSIAVKENDRLRKALTGIASCSTCEACQAAARNALAKTATYPAKPPTLGTNVINSDGHLQ